MPHDHTDEIKVSGRYAQNAIQSKAFDHRSGIHIMRPSNVRTVSPLGCPALFWLNLAPCLSSPHICKYNGWGLRAELLSGTPETSYGLSVFVGHNYAGRWHMSSHSDVCQCPSSQPQPKACAPKISEIRVVLIRTRGVAEATWYAQHESRGCCPIPPAWHGCLRVRICWMDGEMTGRHRDKAKSHQNHLRHILAGLL